ncbi:hypothetical protein FH972_022529 [Carpinus fangiana]|uniref:Large ribosomal subunit protein uL23m n=1 Tax=Carpinus fangiana TaxID=176857 RepID=A0A5N6KSU1_9ROSI|nr:hypothetical protein FH972_022529 [Carpinus fangiana]
MATSAPKFFPKVVKDKLVRSAKSKNTPLWLLAENTKRKAQWKRWTEEGTYFPVGQKKIHLPSFTITFNRTPNLPAKWANFTVPLSFNKLDIRDYLWHLYGVRILSVRSYVVPSAITSKPSPLPGKRRTYRPLNKKRMTVELARPFVWPDVPNKKELDEHFDKQRYDTMMRTRMKEAMEEDVGSRKAREELRLKAERLVQGKESWSSVDASSLSKSGGNTMELPLR